MNRVIDDIESRLTALMILERFPLENFWNWKNNVFSQTRDVRPTDEWGGGKKGLFFFVEGAADITFAVNGRALLTSNR